MSKVVACFSASGSTAKLANTLASAANAVLYEIKPAVPYERRDLNWMDKIPQHCGDAGSELSARTGRYCRPCCGG